MNALDLAIALLVSVPAAWGLWRGLVGGVTGPLALATAVAAGVAAALPVGRALLADHPLASLAGFGAAFVVAYLVVRLAGAGLRRAVAAAGLAWADHLAGGLVAGGAGLLLAAWMAAGAGCLLPGPPAFVRDSEALPYALRIAAESGLSCERRGPADA